MFFEVPGMNLGAPQTEIQKSKIKAKPVATPTAISGTKNSKSKNIEGTERKTQNSSSSGSLSFSSSKKTKKGEVITPKMVSKPVTIVKVKTVEASSTGKSKLQRKMEEKLRGARFRYLNQKLYQSSSRDALNHFKEHPEDFNNYHEGFRSQVVHWPVNPVDLFIEQLDKDLKNNNSKDLKNNNSNRKMITVVDMGCGEAKIMQTFIKNEFVKVHSFDLAASHPGVVVCDMSRVPLPDSSVDIVIFCLSLMNTNFIDAIREARRILKPKTGILRIAEVESRFEQGPNKFIHAVEENGFQKRSLNSQYKVFLLFEFVSSDVKIVKNLKSKENNEVILKPCLYKKR